MWMGRKGEWWDIGGLEGDIRASGVERWRMRQVGVLHVYRVAESGVILKIWDEKMYGSWERYHIEGRGRGSLEGSFLRVERCKWVVLISNIYISVEIITARITLEDVGGAHTKNTYNMLLMDCDHILVIGWEHRCKDSLIYSRKQGMVAMIVHADSATTRVYPCSRIVDVYMTGERAHVSQREDKNYARFYKRELRGSIVVYQHNSVSKITVKAKRLDHRDVDYYRSGDSVFSIGYATDLMGAMMRQLDRFPFSFILYQGYLERLVDVITFVDKTEGSESDNCFYIESVRGGDRCYGATIGNNSACKNRRIVLGSTVLRDNNVLHCETGASLRRQSTSIDTSDEQDSQHVQIKQDSNTD
ncbi:hypothetical protein Tco_0526989 [Tanacetum coccineum]